MNNLFKRIVYSLPFCYNVAMSAFSEMMQSVAKLSSLSGRFDASQGVLFVVREASHQLDAHARGSPAVLFPLLLELPAQDNMDAVVLLQLDFHRVLNAAIFGTLLNLGVDGLAIKALAGHAPCISIRHSGLAGAVLAPDHHIFAPWAKHPSFRAL